jgi:hypothetical protein
LQRSLLASWFGCALLAAWATSVHADDAAAVAAARAEQRAPGLNWVRLEGAASCISAARLAQRIEARIGRVLFTSVSEAALFVDGSLEQELLLLQRSQAALAHEPAGALLLAEQHARDYPHGVFEQEREMLAFEALLELRRKPDALARAERFVQHFPDSAHARRVRGLLDRSRSSGAATRSQRASDSSAIEQP